MEKYFLKDFTGGWVVGNFNPTIFRNDIVEVAVKYFSSGESELPHYQLIASELTIIAQGKIDINGTQYISGEIVLINPLEVATFKCLEDCTLVCIKWPSIPADKILS